MVATILTLEFWPCRFSKDLVFAPAFPLAFCKDLVLASAAPLGFWPCRCVQNLALRLCFRFFSGAPNPRTAF